MPRGNRGAEFDKESDAKLDDEIAEEHGQAKKIKKPGWPKQIVSEVAFPKLPTRAVQAARARAASV